MAVIVLANPKGGSGKTTCALLLATSLALDGVDVTVIDADPERHLTHWSKLPGKPDRISVVSHVSEETVIDDIEEAAGKTPFVIVDLEGTASLLVASAVGVADLVLVPLQGSAMDARGAAKVFRLIENQSRVAGRKIPVSVVLTRIGAAVETRALKNLRGQLSEARFNVLNVGVVERAAFRDVMDYGGCLSKLDPTKVSNPQKAMENATALTAEVLSRLSAVMGINARTEERA